MNIRTFVALRWVVSILMTSSVGALSGLVSFDGVRTWYPLLAKPGFTPPGWVFGPVWTVLYLLTGTGFFLVWNAASPDGKTKAFTAFYVQLFFNFWWPVLFFSFQSIFLALIDCILLLISAAFMMVFFFRVNRTAGYLQIPYLIWVCFATLITTGIWLLNLPEP